MVLCNATCNRNAVIVDPLQRKAASYFFQCNKTLPLLLAGNNKGNIPSLVSFSWYTPCSSQPHRQENANRRILNQITDYDSVALVRCQWHYRGLLLKVENPIRLWLSLELAKAHRLQNDSFKFFDQTELSHNSSGIEGKLRRSGP